MRHIPLLLLTASLADPAVVAAQGTPGLVKDITTQRPYGGGSSPQAGVTIGNLAVFPAYQEATGTEVWCSDGTATGTRLPTETIPGPGLGGAVLDLAQFAGRACFSDGSNLWLSDGTPGGTQPVETLPFAAFSELIEVGGIAYVSGYDRATRAAGLWRTDLTAAGTTLLHTFMAPPQHLTLVGSAVLFFGTEPSAGTELWRTDGTTGGTYLVVDIWPGRASFPGPMLGGSLPVAASRAFFPAHDGTSGRELWCSDGTAAGTRRVLDIFFGSGSGIPQDLPWGAALFGSRVVFAATDGSSGTEPWITDGTAAGTSRIADIALGSGSSTPTGFTSLGNRVCMWADDGVAGVEPWVTDGTASGTSLLRDITPRGFGGAFDAPPRAVVNGQLVFAAGDYVSGCELWVTNGTPGGTALLRDIFAGYGSSYPAPVAVVGGSLLLAADDGVHGRELWRTDGTTAGTSLLGDLEPDLPGTDLYAPMTLGDRLLFAADRGELWRSDKTASGTVRVRSAFNNYIFVREAAGATLPGAVLFAGDDGTSGLELWRSDGTTAGTVLVRDINPAGGSLTWPLGEAVNLAPDVVVFAADNGSNGRQLWRTDGTAAGTLAVTNLAWSGPYDLTVLEPAGDRIVLFIADDGVHGPELWRSDGTAAGTSLVEDIYPGPTGSDDEAGMLAMGSFALLAAADGVAGSELWRSDGTNSGTYLVKDIRPGPAGSIPTLRGARVIGNIAYFVADDGSSGFELWRSDGTAAGTLRVADLRVGIGSSDPAQFAELAGSLLFTADDGGTGRELWISDPTRGTRRLTDLRPGRKTSVAVDGFVFALPGARRALFTASDGQTPGLQLWWTDGTTVARHHAGSHVASFGKWPHLAGASLFTPVWDSVSGRELWAMRSMAAAVPFGHACRGSNGWPTLRGTGPVLGTSCDLRVTAAPRNTAAAIGLDTARAAVPLGAGCTLLLATIPVVLPAVAIDAAGQGGVALAVPAVPALNGRQLFVQMAAFDPSAARLAWTNGLQLVLATE